MNDLFDDLPQQAEQLHDQVFHAAHQVRDFTRRLELILSQDHRKLPIRDEAFTSDFTAFCTELRQQLDVSVAHWQQLREQIRKQLTARQYPTSLQAKSFAMRAKTLSRTCDDFTTAYDTFNNVYKNYTLSKLPVWVLSSCCEDANHLIGKLLFLSRELAKHAGKVSGVKK